jgi:hypothetical protein
MADQTIKVSNMPDSGSPQAVAFQLWDRLNWHLPEKSGIDAINQSLDLFATCLRAAHSTRKTSLE